MRIYYVIFVFWAIMTSCKNEINDELDASNIDSIKIQKEKDGWSFLEDMGEKEDYVKSLIVRTPKRIQNDIKWKQNGVEYWKTYLSDTKGYLVCFFEKKNGDDYVLVFERNE